MGLVVAITGAAPCPFAPGYTFYPGKDSPGADLGSSLGVQDVQALVIACSKSTSCMGFTTTGQLKAAIASNSALTNITDATSCSGLYVRAQITGAC